MTILLFILLGPARIKTKHMCRFSQKRKLDMCKQYSETEREELQEGWRGRYMDKWGKWLSQEKLKMRDG